MNPFARDKVACSGVDKSVAGCVLLVDDEPIVLRALVRLLQDSWAVDTADSAENAMRLLGTKAYDVVVTDYEMTGHNGIWLLQQVENLYPRMRRVLHSGSDPANVETYVRSGLVQRYVQKPATPGQLIASLSPPPPY